MKLHLGVFDIPYVGAGGTTTGDVAEILEAKYHVMETFYELHSQEVADSLANSFEGALESVAMGRRVDPATFFQGGTSAIEASFRQFLATGEMEALGIPGVPTKAALKGVSHRFKRKRGGPRPSFIDTGQYEAAMHAWIED